MKWQPIETAPDNDDIVLVALAGGRVVSGWRDSMGAWLSAEECRNLWEPTHWMPLPEPPEE